MSTTTTLSRAPRRKALPAPPPPPIEYLKLWKLSDRQRRRCDNPRADHQTSETVAKSPFDDDLDRIAEAIDDEIACEVCAPNGAPLNETRIINGEERRLVRRRTDSEIYLGEMWAVGHGSRFDVRDPYNGVADILETEAAKLLAVAGRVRAAAKAK